jgi:ubiquinone/menaquinone biosynthesis C-methylase UbiE
VKEFPGPGAFEDLFRAAGFTSTGYQLVTFGIAAIHWGAKA